VKRLIVFDAVYGPCYGNPGGYVVLNGCTNEVYQPGENPLHTRAASNGGNYFTPGPWMRDFPDQDLCAR